jgi:Domain of unknown function (DUF1902)
MARARRHAVEVHAVWDLDAEVWSAEAENLPGLVTEADTTEALMSKLRVMVPELLSYSPDLAAKLGPEIHLVLERNFEAQPASLDRWPRANAAGEGSSSGGGMPLRSARRRRSRDLALSEVTPAGRCR